MKILFDDHLSSGTTRRSRIHMNRELILTNSLGVRIGEGLCHGWGMRVNNLTMPSNGAEIGAPPPDLTRYKV